MQCWPNDARHIEAGQLRPEIIHREEEDIFWGTLWQRKRHLNYHHLKQHHDGEGAEDREQALLDVEDRSQCRKLAVSRVSMVELAPLGIGMVRESRKRKGRVGGR